MKIGYLGAGTWGFALAAILAENGHEVISWTRDPAFAELLQRTRAHPKFPGIFMPASVHFTSNLPHALHSAEVIVESVTSPGLRPVFQEIGPVKLPIILTSKGIEQHTGYLLPEVISELHAMPRSPLVGCLSGPSLADETLQKKPTSVVAAAYDQGVTKLICDLFTTPTFRVYPNTDLHGICFGGAMKNVIAIACGISDGLTGSDNAKAALMTRGLHEMRKLSFVKQGNPETLSGLSGMGDLCVTCMSPKSRNYRFGKLIAEGFSPEGARQKIGMAIEGMYTCDSAQQLGRKHHIPLPITDATYAVIFKGLDPRVAMKELLTRLVKEERL